MWKKFLARLFFIASCTLLAPLVAAYDGSRFNDIKAVVFDKPYNALPDYRVDRKRFGDSGNSPGNHLLAASRRTLRSNADLIDFPQHHKLLNPNGICFAGEWRIDKESAYTGQFAMGTKSHAIVRASVALSGTLQQHKRAFGLAIKLFPGSDGTRQVRTLNAFVMHSLGGIRSPHVLDLPLDNEPSLGSLPALSQLRVALRMRKDLNRANVELGASPSRLFFQPVSHLAKWNSTAQSLSPIWLRLVADERLPRINKPDFRQELSLAYYPDNTLIWHIDVAGKLSADSHTEPLSTPKKHARWQRIGQLLLTQSVVSDACDKRLHFAHAGRNN